MKKLRQSAIILPLLLFGYSFTGNISAQMITGVWKGKINRQKVEVKLIQDGDSLRGTSYYYESANNYRRYSIKGYFDQNTNSAVWWDDQLLEEKSGRFNISVPGKIPMLSRADFNCPGGGKMMLDGKASYKEEEDKPKGDVDLDKTTTTQFKDEWDYVIDNYTVGGNDPDIIDSITNFYQQSTTNKIPTEKPVETISKEKQVVAVPVVQKIIPKTEPVVEKSQTVVISQPEKPLTIEEKFITRKKVFIKDIPVSGDSVELRFYDNAEIDGDSISLFLNDRLLFQNIRLTGNAYTIKLAVSELNTTNELIMVAENLGSIPPNTSYMVAIINNERHDAYLASSEGSSAMIRLVKK